MFSRPTANYGIGEFCAARHKRCRAGGRVRGMQVPIRFFIVLVAFFFPSLNLGVGLEFPAILLDSARCCLAQSKLSSQRHFNFLEVHGQKPTAILYCTTKRLYSYNMTSAVLRFWLI